MTFRKKLYLILEPSEKGEGVVERIFEYLLISMIILNIIAIVLASMEDEYNRYEHVFNYFELFSVVFFYP
jgi:voltage-gated potassium channel